MTSLHRHQSVVVLTLTVAALAAPIAQAGSAHPDLAGQTEAKGYAALSQAILNTSRLQSQSHGFASQSEAKGYAALSQAILNTSRLQNQPQVVPSGFDWGDAGIGAAATLGIVLLAIAALATLTHSRGRQPKHA